MTFVTCAGCGLKVDNKIAACAHCGAKPRAGARTGIIVAAVIGGIIILSNLLSLLLSAPAPASASLTPTATQAVKAPDPAREARLKRALVVVTLVKTGLRDPDSVSWQHIRANDDASVVCLEYRARNGFGGLNLERTAYVGGRLSNESKAWNKNCAAKKLFDLDYLRHSL
jgi:hypothetical protein